MTTAQTKHSFKVLLIDDDTFISDMYVLKFNRAGHELTVAGSAADALENLRAGHTYDAIATDMVMPGQDGLEFVKQIKQEGLLGDAVLLVLSNQDEPALVRDFRELGAKEHIVKAHHLPNEVLKMVECAIDTYKYAGAYGYCA